MNAEKKVSSIPIKIITLFMEYRGEKAAGSALLFTA